MGQDHLRVRCRSAYGPCTELAEGCYREKIPEIPPQADYIRKNFDLQGIRPERSLIIPLLDAKHGRRVLNVVFDLGGVVLTWDPTTIVASVFDDDRDRILIIEAVFAHPDWKALDCGTLSRNEAVDRAVARTHVAQPKLYALFEAIPRALVPVSSTLGLITQVREAGNRLYVLSNLHRTSFECVCSTYTIFDLFDGWVVSCEVGMCKPDPAIYRRLLDDFALDPAATVFIDDMPSNVDVAAKLGIGTILFRDVASCRDQLQSLGCI